MAFSPIKTYRMQDKLAWSATQRRRKAEKKLTDADPSKSPATVNEGSAGSPSGTPKP